MKKPEYIFVHHTAVSYDKNGSQWVATNNYHKKKWHNPPKVDIESSLGFFGGYNYEMDKVGGIHQFRKDGERTVAQYQKGMNDGRAISIALDGNFDMEQPTDDQCLSLHTFLVQKMQEHNIPRSNIKPHRWVAPKTCPGRLIPDDIMGYLEARLGFNTMPAWAEESVEIAKKTGIATEWGRPHDDITNEEMAIILYRVGLTKRQHKRLSKLEFVHILYKAGLLKPRNR